MASYTLGRKVRFKGFDGKRDCVVIEDTKNAYVGFRAYAFDEMEGHYREVLEFGPDGTEYVQGEFQGSYVASTHESREDASRLAWRAWRFLNAA